MEAKQSFRERFAGALQTIKMKAKEAIKPTFRSTNDVPPGVVFKMAKSGTLYVRLVTGEIRRVFDKDSTRFPRKGASFESLRDYNERLKKSYTPKRRALSKSA